MKNNRQKPDRVLLEDVDAGSPSIGRPLAEDVAHVRAGDDLQGAVAHPGLETRSILIF